MKIVKILFITALLLKVEHLLLEKFLLDRKQFAFELRYSMCAQRGKSSLKELPEIEVLI